MRCALTLGLLLTSLAACPAKRKQAPGEPVKLDTAVASAAAVAEPLPEVDADGSLGVAEAVRFVAAADDGSWVMTCPTASDAPARLRVVVGDGPGILVDRAVATSDRDLLVIDGDALVHVDVVARTRRKLGPAAVASIDPDSRRLVRAGDRALIVQDLGVPPRTVPVGAGVAWIWRQSKRWMQVAPGEPGYGLNQGSCGLLQHYPSEFRFDEQLTIDLDPSGVEAADRVGPELGITAAGEVTLDGTVVAGADCVGNVIAALADPPRALVMCHSGAELVVGPGFRKEVGGWASTVDGATIVPNLILGRRLVCIQGACIDLVTGRSFDTNDGAMVWATDRLLIRKRGAGLVIDALDEDHPREIALPRVTQAVTVDTATGRRRTGPAPASAAYVDGSGQFLLFGRYVIDVEAGLLVATLPDDALAIDRTGRVLVSSSPGLAPLRWKRP